MPAVEREVVIKAPEVSEIPKIIDALRNGQNTPEMRLQALKLILEGQVDSSERRNLMETLEKAWRKAGDISDEFQLDTANLEPIKIG